MRLVESKDRSTKRNLKESNSHSANLLKELASETHVVYCIPTNYSEKKRIEVLSNFFINQERLKEHDLYYKVLRLIMKEICNLQTEEIKLIEENLNVSDKIALEALKEDMIFENIIKYLNKNELVMKKENNEENTEKLLLIYQIGHKVYSRLETSVYKSKLIDEHLAIQRNSFEFFLRETIMSPNAFLLLVNRLEIIIENARENNRLERLNSDLDFYLPFLVNKVKITPRKGKIIDKIVKLLSYSSNENMILALLPELFRIVAEDSLSNFDFEEYDCIISLLVKIKEKFSLEKCVAIINISLTVFKKFFDQQNPDADSQLIKFVLKFSESILLDKKNEEMSFLMFLDLINFVILYTKKLGKNIKKSYLLGNLFMSKLIKVTTLLSYFLKVLNGSFYHFEQNYKDLESNEIQENLAYICYKITKFSCKLFNNSHMICSCLELLLENLKTLKTEKLYFIFNKFFKNIIFKNHQPIDVGFYNFFSKDYDIFVLILHCLLNTFYKKLKGKKKIEAIELNLLFFLLSFYQPLYLTSQEIAFLISDFYIKITKILTNSLFKIKGLDDNIFEVWTKYKKFLMEQDIANNLKYGYATNKVIRYQQRLFKFYFKQRNLKIIEILLNLPYKSGNHINIFNENIKYIKLLIYISDFDMFTLFMKQLTEIKNILFKINLNLFDCKEFMDKKFLEHIYLVLLGNNTLYQLYFKWINEIKNLYPSIIKTEKNTRILRKPLENVLSGIYFLKTYVSSNKNRITKKISKIISKANGLVEEEKEKEWSLVIKNLYEVILIKNYDDENGLKAFVKLISKKSCFLDLLFSFVDLQIIQKNIMIPVYEQKFQQIFSLLSKPLKEDLIKNIQNSFRTQKNLKTTYALFYCMIFTTKKNLPQDILAPFIKHLLSFEILFTESVIEKELKNNIYIVDERILIKNNLLDVLLKAIFLSNKFNGKVAKLIFKQLLFNNKKIVLEFKNYISQNKFFPALITKVLTQKYKVINFIKIVYCFIKIGICDIGIFSKNEDNFKSLLLNLIKVINQYYLDKKTNNSEAYVDYVRGYYGIKKMEVPIKNILGILNYLSSSKVFQSYVKSVVNNSFEVFYKKLNDKYSIEILNKIVSYEALKTNTMSIITRLEKNKDFDLGTIKLLHIISKRSSEYLVLNVQQFFVKQMEVQAYSYRNIASHRELFKEKKNIMQKIWKMFDGIKGSLIKPKNCLISFLITFLNVDLFTASGKVYLGIKTNKKLFLQRRMFQLMDGYPEIIISSLLIKNDKMPKVMTNVFFKFLETKDSTKTKTHFIENIKFLLKTVPNKINLIESFSRICVHNIIKNKNTSSLNLDILSLNNQIREINESEKLKEYIQRKINANIYLIQLINFVNGIKKDIRFLIDFDIMKNIKSLQIAKVLTKMNVFEAQRIDDCKIEGISPEIMVFLSKESKLTLLKNQKINYNDINSIFVAYKLINSLEESFNLETCTSIVKCTLESYRVWKSNLLVKKEALTCISKIIPLKVKPGILFAKNAVIAFITEELGERSLIERFNLLTILSELKKQKIYVDGNIKLESPALRNKTDIFIKEGLSLVCTGKITMPKNLNMIEFSNKENEVIFRILKIFIENGKNNEIAGLYIKELFLYVINSEKLFTESLSEEIFVELTEFLLNNLDNIKISEKATLTFKKNIFKFSSSKQLIQKLKENIFSFFNLMKNDLIGLKKVLESNIIQKDNHEFVFKNLLNESKPINNESCITLIEVFKLLRRENSNFLSEYLNLLSSLNITNKNDEIFIEITRLILEKAVNEEKLMDLEHTFSVRQKQVFYLLVLAMNSAKKEKTKCITKKISTDKIYFKLIKRVFTNNLKEKLTKILEVLLIEENDTINLIKIKIVLRLLNLERKKPGNSTTLIEYIKSYIQSITKNNYIKNYWRLSCLKKLFKEMDLLKIENKCVLETLKSSISKLENVYQLNTAYENCNKKNRMIFFQLIHRHIKTILAINDDRYEVYIEFLVYLITINRIENGYKYFFTAIRSIYKNKNCVPVPILNLLNSIPNYNFFNFSMLGFYDSFLKDKFSYETSTAIDHLIRKQFTASFIYFYKSIVLITQKLDKNNFENNSSSDKGILQKLSLLEFEMQFSLKHWISLGSKLSINKELEEYSYFMKNVDQLIYILWMGENHNDFVSYLNTLIFSKSSLDEKDKELRNTLKYNQKIIYFHTLLYKLINSLKEILLGFIEINNDKSYLCQLDRLKFNKNFIKEKYQNMEVELHFIKTKIDREIIFVKNYERKGYIKFKKTKTYSVKFLEECLSNLELDSNIYFTHLLTIKSLLETVENYINTVFYILSFIEPSFSTDKNCRAVKKLKTNILELSKGNNNLINSNLSEYSFNLNLKTNMIEKIVSCTVFVFYSICGLKPIPLFKNTDFSVVQKEFAKLKQAIRLSGFELVKNRGEKNIVSENNNYKETEGIYSKVSLDLKMEYTRVCRRRKLLKASKEAILEFTKKFKLNEEDISETQKQLIKILASENQGLQMALTQFQTLEVAGMHKKFVSEITRLKCSILIKKKDFAKVSYLFAQSMMHDPSNNKSWLDWGNFSDQQFSVSRKLNLANQAFLCYIKCIKAKFPPGVSVIPKIIWLLSYLYNFGNKVNSAIRTRDRTNSGLDSEGYSDEYYQENKIEAKGRRKSIPEILPVENIKEVEFDSDLKLKTQILDDKVKNMIDSLTGIPTYFWLLYIPDLLRNIWRQEASLSVVIIRNLCHNYPESVFFFAKRYLSLVPEAFINKENVFYSFNNTNLGKLYTYLGKQKEFSCSEYELFTKTISEAMKANLAELIYKFRQLVHELKPLTLEKEKMQEENFMINTKLLVFKKFDYLIKTYSNIANSEDKHYKELLGRVFTIADTFRKEGRDICKLLKDIKSLLLDYKKHLVESATSYTVSSVLFVPLYEVHYYFIDFSSKKLKTSETDNIIIPFFNDPDYIYTYGQTYFLQMTDMYGRVHTYEIKKVRNFKKTTRIERFERLKLQLNLCLKRIFKRKKRIYEDTDLLTTEVAIPIGKDFLLLYKGSNFPLLELKTAFEKKLVQKITEKGEENIFILNAPLKTKKSDRITLLKRYYTNLLLKKIFAEEKKFRKASFSVIYEDNLYYFSQEANCLELDIDVTEKMHEISNIKLYNKLLVPKDENYTLIFSVIKKMLSLFSENKLFLESILSLICRESISDNYIYSFLTKDDYQSYLKEHSLFLRNSRQIKQYIKYKVPEILKFIKSLAYNLAEAEDNSEKKDEESEFVPSLAKVLSSMGV